MPDSPDSFEQVEGLKVIFEETAASVARAQAGLDRDLDDLLARHETRARAFAYSIPRVGVELEFGLRIVDEKRMLLVLPRGSRKELRNHRLSFDLVAVPDPPPPLDSAPGAFPFYLSEPHFMLPPDEEPLRFAQLIAALSNPARRFSLLPSGELKREKLEREVNRLVRAFLKDGGDRERLRKSAPEGGGEFLRLVNDAISDVEAGRDVDTNMERGLVYFRLDTAPASYLVARVTDKSKNDSLFVLRPDGTGGATNAEIYSVEGDNTPSVAYRPLHVLGLTLRHWLEGARPLFVKVADEDWPHLVAGLENLQAFAEKLREGYARGASALAAASAAKPGTPAYDLAEVFAELSYVVDYDKSDGGETTGARIEFERQSGDGDDYVLIQSRAFVRAVRSGRYARIEVALAAPEFALSGSARERFLSFFSPTRRILRDISREIGEREAERYAGFIARKDYRRSVVVLLSYKGNRPKQQFLVIWPGTNREGSPKSFAFTCERVDDSEDLKLTRWVLGVDEALDDVLLDTSAAPDDPAGGPLPAADKNLSEEQYQVFHNFFHAVRIWRSRVRTRAMR
jgi:hypothetical protein